MGGQWFSQAPQCALPTPPPNQVLPISCEYSSLMGNTWLWPCVTFPTSVVVSTLEIFTVLGKTLGEACWRWHEAAPEGQVSRSHLGVFFQMARNKPCKQLISKNSEQCIRPEVPTRPPPPPLGAVQQSSEYNLCCIFFFNSSHRFIWDCPDCWCSHDVFLW